MKRKRVNILGVYFDNVTMDEAIRRCVGFFKRPGQFQVYTPNPEIVMEAYEDKELRQHLNEGSLVIPDGIGVVIGSKIIGKPLKERVAGYDLGQNLMKILKDTDKTIFLYGAKPGVAKQASDKMMKKYKGLKIVGNADGYRKDMDDLCQEINRVKPDVLMVGLGAPKQEAWIARYGNQLDVKVLMGVGGSIDVMAGVVRRAPDFFIKLHLEWFYRLLKQPTRFKRMLRLPLFLWKMIIEGRRYREV